MGLWRNIMSASQSSSLPNGRRYEVVGTRPIHHDGVETVTGQARYGADIWLPGMLYGKVWHSPHAHARIKAIDTSRAAASPGVPAVVTAADRPQSGCFAITLAFRGMA
jgi:xanthine dehydrogenase molybdenum-binding subunit